MCVYDIALYICMCERVFACGLELLCACKSLQGEHEYVFMLYRAPPSPQDPIPEMVKPSRGPKAGGTLITISGRFLETGSKEDVQVTIGVVECTV